MVLVYYFAERIKENIPYHKIRESALPAWANEFRLMEYRDKVLFEDISVVLKWSQESSDFWKKNILSAGKFREQFSRLCAEVKGDRKVDQEKRVGASTRPADPKAKDRKKAAADLGKRLWAEAEVKIKEIETIPDKEVREQMMSDLEREITAEVAKVAYGEGAQA